MSVHVVPRKIYYAVFASLLALTALTVVVAFFDLGPLNTPVALGVACIKAFLVILFFMHVRYAERLTAIVITVSFLFLGLLIVITLSDYLSRGWLPFPGK